MKKLKLIRLMAVLAMLAGLLAVPSISAEAAHPTAGILVIDAPAAVCGTAVPKTGGALVAKECLLYADAISTASPVPTQETLPGAGGKVITGLVLPGLGDPVGVAAAGGLGVPCHGVDGLLPLPAPTGGCEGGWAFAAGTAAPGTTCVLLAFLPALAVSDPCGITATGLLGAGVNGVGAYVGSSGGLGAGTITTGLAAPLDSQTFRIEWEQSAATLLPLHGDIEGHDGVTETGATAAALLAGPGCTLTSCPPTPRDSIIGLVSARPLVPAPGCPVLAGGNNAGIGDADGDGARDGTKCFRVIGFIWVKVTALS